MLRKALLVLSAACSWTAPYSERIGSAFSSVSAAGRLLALEVAFFVARVLLCALASFGESPFFGYGPAFVHEDAECFVTSISMQEPTL